MHWLWGLALVDEGTVFLEDEWTGSSRLDEGAGTST